MTARVTVVGLLGLVGASAGRPNRRRRPLTSMATTCDKCGGGDLLHLDEWLFGGLDTQPSTSADLTAECASCGHEHEPVVHAG